MGKLLLFLGLVCSLLASVALHVRRTPRVTIPEAIGCTPPPGVSAPDAMGRFAPVFPGWGHYHVRVRTASDSAQFFFDQGINLYYSYHLTEALASFKEAARFDPGCMMAYWGQALSMGPYYNSYYYKMPVTVLDALEQMDRAGTSDTRERDLADAMHARYGPTDAHRPELNRAYAAKMAALVRKYPSDPDIRALYVDAVMLEHSWDFWEPDGAPKPWTGELIACCDTILRDHPTHPAALHYEIHLVEASRHPEKALANADLLKNTMPGVSHMVHMSSHMYQRNGLYAAGVEVNEQAAGLQYRYDSMAPSLEIGLQPLQHFDAVGAFCAMNANMYRKAMRSALDLRSRLPKDHLSNTFLQYLYMLPALASVRSGKWDAIMKEQAPDSSLSYALILYSFARGIACLRVHDTAAAGRCLAALRGAMKDPALRTRNPPFNAPIQAATVAEDILEGELAADEGRPEDAIRLLENAVTTEDRMIYREPKEWPIPARHYLGDCLLKYHKPGDAEAVFQQDLVLNPGNGWSSLGLYLSLTAQHKSARKTYIKAFADADEVPTAPVY